MGYADDSDPHRIVAITLGFQNEIPRKKRSLVGRELNRSGPRRIVPSVNVAPGRAPPSLALPQPIAIGAEMDFRVKHEISLGVPARINDRESKRGAGRREAERGRSDHVQAGRLFGGYDAGTG